MIILAGAVRLENVYYFIKIIMYRLPTPTYLYMNFCYIIKKFVCMYAAPSGCSICSNHGRVNFMCHFQYSQIQKQKNGMFQCLTRFPKYKCSYSAKYFSIQLYAVAELCRIGLIVAS